MKRLRFLALVGLLLAVPTPAEEPAQPKEYKAHVTGYAHIDMAWLWRWEESTYDIMFNTFSNQLKLMEVHPEFTFAQDQAVVYEMMEKFYPEISQGIRQRVRTGQWIPVSSTWSQTDENMPDGESLVRQFLYGQKATRERFGRYVRVAWQPDVFGHPASMPQIARKAGIEWYLFGRPQVPSRPPIFWWQSPDGSRVLGYNPPGWYTQEVNHENFTVKLRNEADRAGVKDMLVLFGQGDHGGGPNPNDLAHLAALRSSPHDVQIKFTNVENYFELLLAGKQDFPVWAGEHNPVFEGCYTTQVEMKRHNRQAEQLLLAAEKMSEWARFGNYRDYFPSRDLGEAWKLTLLNQTHDLLPGSGIGPIYKDAAKQYDEIFERGQRALNFSLQSLGLQLDTRGDGIPLVVYNTQSWDRTDLVTAELAGLALPRQMVVRAGDEVVPVQILKPAARDGARERATIAFVASVPQMGLKLYRILPAPAAPPPAVQAGLKPRPFLENEFLRVEVNPATGNIARVYDKQAQREALREGGAFLVALEDTAEQARKDPSYVGSAWNLGLTGVKWEIHKPERIEVTESGPARATLRVVRRFRDSIFTEEISLTAKVPRVDVESSADFYERSTFIKAGFPVAVGGSLATEIPYGVQEHPQTGQETVMGKWVDISDSSYGVAILNNGRHGFDAQDNTIRISVIRGPWGPDPRADEGHHTFGYAIYPHRGGWREGKVQRQALSFNAPLLALQEPVHHSPQEQWAGKSGGLPSPTSFIKVASDHVLLTAMKQMEGFYDTDAILRFYESEGREGNVAIELPFKVRATETDLLEETIAPAGEGARIEFKMKPWEIKTLRLARMP
jgi:alpha-mannosidase